MVGAVTAFLTNPQMGKAGEEYHFEYCPGSRVSLNDFMHKFESFMNFEKNSHTNLGRSM